ncbi:MAG: protein kinase domain-containing protein [Solirubrobacteraceae bacterium]
MPICDAVEIEMENGPVVTSARNGKSGASPDRPHPAPAGVDSGQPRAPRCAQGTVVDGRYRVLECIGSGATAAVYVAEDLVLGRCVALKVLHPCFAYDGELAERFRRKACCAAAIRHEHIVSVYDRGEWDGTHYIAMEYVDGRSLKSIVRDEAPLAPQRVIELAVQLLRAAGCIHRHGIVHRDLKPDNAIVDRDGHLKVTDFGIARTGVSDITRTGSIVGSVQYVSPEQAAGHTLTASSDLYSVGVILYELLTGCVPFEGESVVTVALKHVNERPARPRTFNAAIPPELEAVVMRALEKDPARRFSDADAFIESLERTRITALAATEPAGAEAAGAPSGNEALAETKRWGVLRRTWLSPALKVRRDPRVPSTAPS